MEYINSFKDIIMSNSILAYFIIFFIGFISSLNPHMLSMVPIFMGNVITDENSTKRWFKVSLFSLSFAVTLTIMGIVVSLIGSSLHTLMSLSYILAGLIYVYMGLNLFGIKLKELIPIQIIVLRNHKQTYIDKVVKNIGMSLIFTPCSLPFVISILTLAMVKGSMLYGGLILFSFGLGHSLIFFIFGISSNILFTLGKKLKSQYIIHKILGLIMMIIGMFFLLVSSKTHM